MNRLFATLTILFNCILCIGSMAYSLPTNTVIGLIPDVKDYTQPLISVITGAVLTSGCFFFFLRRMIIQYDKRHEKHETQILDLYLDTHEFETSVGDRLHEQAEVLQKEIRQELISTIKTIVDNFDSLRDTIQDLVSNFASLKAEHNQCDYRSGDINLINSQLENMLDSFNRIENQISKHIEDSKK